MSACCETMAAQLDTRCPQHGSDCPDRVVRQSGLSGRFLLVAENAAYDFEFCPWCGKRFQDPETFEDGPAATARRLFVDPSA